MHACHQIESVDLGVANREACVIPILCTETGQIVYRIRTEACHNLQLQ